MSAGTDGSSGTGGGAGEGTGAPTEATRYRALPFAIDEHEGDVWAAPLPDGPMMNLQGIAVLILDLLAEAKSPCGVAEIAGRLREHVADAPPAAEAEVLVGDFLERLCALRMAERV